VEHRGERLEEMVAADRPRRGTRERADGEVVATDISAEMLAFGRSVRPRRGSRTCAFM
jgi:ubiquinone/menaquinone biosynthesis C-methylase UbiE